MPFLAVRSVIGYGIAALLAGLTPSAAQDMKIPRAQAEPLAFEALDGWKSDDHAAAFAAYLKSCSAILQGTKAMRAAKPVYGALFKVCERAVAAGNLNRDQARAFFEANLKPVKLAPQGQTEGFFTGYYETEVTGSRFPSDEFTVPVYRSPVAASKFGRNKGKASELDRTEIEEGKLAGKGLEICYVKSPVDAFFAQIQGSTRVRLDTGETLRLNYESHNGQPYTPVGKFLIERGIYSREEMSMTRIRQWMEANPDEGKELRRKNKSFVFFREVALKEHDECIGAQGVPLTAGRSVAVDKGIHVYGTPIWIEAQLPIESEKPETPFRRLAIAQDTGSAIIGPARADIYFGFGEDVGHVAGRIKQFGKFVMLVPKTVEVKAIEEIPLPKPRPADLVADNAPAEKTEAHALPGVPLPKRRPQT